MNEASYLAGGAAPSDDAGVTITDRSRVAVHGVTRGLLGGLVEPKLTVNSPTERWEGLYPGARVRACACVSARRRGPVSLFRYQTPTTTGPLTPRRDVTVLLSLALPQNLQGKRTSPALLL